jgi:hypothetical protein
VIAHQRVTRSAWNAVRSRSAITASKAGKSAAWARRSVSCGTSTTAVSASTTFAITTGTSTRPTRNRAWNQSIE